MNWNMIGHHWAVSLLQKHILSDNPRHAYLFAGPSGLGKKTLALRTAQALFCGQTDLAADPCLTCQTCRRIEKLEHPDLYPVRTQDDSQVIKIDQIRELQHALSLSPYEAAYQIALLEDFQTATPSAQNALLKTLEEPPPRVILILTAESKGELLETIVSRCEILQLRMVPLEVIQTALVKKFSLPEAQAKKLAHISGGRPGCAIHYLEHPERLAERERWIQDHQKLLGSSLADRFEYAKGYKKDSALFREVAGTWLTLWRDVLLTASGADAPLINLDHRAHIQKLAGLVEVNTTHQIIKELEKTRKALGLYANTQLTIERLLIHLPKLNA